MRKGKRTPPMPPPRTIDESLAYLAARFPGLSLKFLKNKREVLSKMVGEIDRLDALLQASGDNQRLSNAVLELLGTNSEGQGLTELLVRYLEYLDGRVDDDEPTNSTSESIEGIGALIYGHQQRLDLRVQEVDKAAADVYRAANHPPKPLEGPDSNLA